MRQGSLAGCVVCHQLRRGAENATRMERHHLQGGCGESGIDSYGTPPSMCLSATARFALGCTDNLQTGNVGLGTTWLGEHRQGLTHEARVQIQTPCVIYVGALTVCAPASPSTAAAAARPRAPEIAWRRARRHLRLRTPRCAAAQGAPQTARRSCHHGSSACPARPGVNFFHHTLAERP